MATNLTLDAYVVCDKCGTRWTVGYREGTTPPSPRECRNPECDATWLDLSMFMHEADADRAASGDGGDPPPELAHMEYQAREYDAWQVVVAELRRAGVRDINRGEAHETLHDAIVLWGEELAQLRLHDPNPDHAETALAERREGMERHA